MIRAFCSSCSSAKAIRKELVSLGADEREVKAARKEIDEVVSHPD
jgi:hypothetical protein